METGADGKIVEATEKASPEASVSTIVDERAAAGAGTTPDTADRIGGIAAAAKEEEEEEGEGLVLEQPLLTIKEVFVYRVPPLRAASGHRAEEWGLANPVFTGMLKVAQVGDTCCLRLFKPPPEGELGALPELFAESVVRLDKGRPLQVFVESVIDSSRYFVLMCEDKASGRHAFVGIGFRERSSSFDLKAVLDDFVRFIDRQRAAEASAAEQQQQQEQGDAEGEAGHVKQVRDLSIAEGQKVHLELKVGSNGSSRPRRRPRSEAPKSGGGVLLPPPPQAGATYKVGATPARSDVTPPSPPPPKMTSPRQTAPSDVTPSWSDAAGRGAKASESGSLSSTGAYVRQGGEEDAVGVDGPSGHPGDGGDRGVNETINEDHSDQDNPDEEGWGDFESA